MSFKNTIFQRELEAVEPAAALEPEKDWGYRQGDGEYVNEDDNSIEEDTENKIVEPVVIPEIEVAK